MPLTATYSPIQRFWLLLKPDQSEIRNVYIYAFFNGLVNLSLPIGIQSIINLIQGGQMNSSWVILVSFVILGVALTGLLQISQLKITEHLQQKIFTRAAFEFAYRIPKIKLEALYKHYAPELMNRFFDVVSVQKGLSKILIDFSTASIQSVFGLILLSLYHPFFIIFSLILIALLFIIFKLTGRKGLETSLEESESKYDVAHWLEELARTNVTFKLAGKTDLPLDRIDKSTEKYVKARENHFKVLIQQYSLMVVFKVLVAMGLLVIGSILVMEQQMNIGQFVAAEIIILLVLASVEKLILSLETIYDVLTSLEKIGQVTDLELESETGVDIGEHTPNKGLSVELAHINFKYPEQHNLILNDVSMKIEEGEKVIIKGENNSGKSTLLYMLAGVYEPDSGFISYNDLPVGNLELSTLRTIIGDCLMDELLFEGTVFENISMGREDATFENVKWAIDMMGLTEFVKQLPQGFDTTILPQGRQFSDGIVSKLVMARSIADKPRLLLIKDVFSSIESKERKRILNFLFSPEHPWTLVVATAEEDKSLEAHADKLYVIKNGELSLKRNNKK